jgi:hypothetical protein
MGQPHIWKKDRDTGQMAKRPNHGEKSWTTVGLWGNIGT